MTSSKKSKGKGTSPSVRVSNEPEEFASQTPSLVEGPVVELALNKLRVDESKNLRKFPVPTQYIRELADSIKARGFLINPLIVYPVPENGDGATHQLDAGYQRVKALALLAEEGNPIPVRATVISGPSEEINLDENERRKDLSAMDRAYILKEKVEGGMAKGAAGKLLGLSPATVTRLLRLVNLRPEVQTKIHKGEVRARVAMVLPELSEAEQDELLADLEKPGESASTKATKAKAKKGRKGKQGRKKSKSTSIDATELYAAVESQVETVKALEKVTVADKKSLELYACLRGFLSGKMSMKALHKRVLVLVAPR